MKLKDAIQEQINRMTEETPQSPPDTEIKNLLEAFVSLINAYLQRIGSEEKPRSSDTFGTLG